MMQPSERFWIMFGWLGILTVAGLVMLMAYFAFDALRGAVRDLRWQYKYKHRFDKQPTAKCYCKDCVYHTTKNSSGNGPCGLPGGSRWTPDNGFCHEAEPRKKDDDND